MGCESEITGKTFEFVWILGIWVKVEIAGKCLKLYFKLIWKVIDSFLIEDILESEFPIIIGNMLLWDLLF